MHDIDQISVEGGGSVDKEAIKADIQAGLFDIIRHLERRETEGLFSREKKEESLAKFVTVAQRIAACLDDPDNEIHTGAPLVDGVSAITHFACGMEPDLLPYCRLLQYRMQRHREQR